VLTVVELDESSGVGMKESPERPPGLCFQGSAVTSGCGEDRAKGFQPRRSPRPEDELVCRSPSHMWPQTQRLQRRPTMLIKENPSAISNDLSVTTTCQGNTQNDG
jgi:hypothetical protein